MGHFDCLVVGAGIHGLCTAFWLRRAGIHRIAVLERGAPGHAEGSSHGALRITRSSYHEATFVQLAAEANRSDWPAIEHALGSQLRLPTPGLFFGPPSGPFGAWLAATLGSGAHVEQIEAAAARRRFPLLRIADGDACLLDHTAAVVLAAATMAGLRAWLAAAGVALCWRTPVLQFSGGDVVRAVTPAGEFTAPCAVLAAGPWLGRLSPADEPMLTVQRQEVGYFDVDAPPDACAPGTFPVWAHIADGPEGFQYGLPSHDGSGLKAAFHRTAGVGVDPDVAPPPIDADALLALARERFCVPVRRLRAAEHCLYTVTPDHGFVVRRREDMANVVTIAACSGHGFKFGPLVGRMAAELLAPGSR